MIKHIFLTLVITGSLALLTLPAAGQVILDNSDSSSLVNSSSGTISNFDFGSSANLLIAVFSGRPGDAGGTSGNSHVSSVTYGTGVGAQSFTQFEFAQVNSTEAQIWYLANPTDVGGADVIFDVTSSQYDDRGALLGVYSLENADTDTGNWIVDEFQETSGDPEISLSNVSSGSFFIDVYSQGATGSTIDGATGVTRDASSPLFDGNMDNYNGYSSFASIASSGNLTAGIDITDPNASSYVGVAINVIPEPEVGSLIILGGLATLLIRRRRRQG